MYLLWVARQALTAANLLAPDYGYHIGSHGWYWQLHNLDFGKMEKFVISALYTWTMALISSTLMKHVDTPDVDTPCGMLQSN